MAKYDKIMKNTFESGNVRDALVFLTACVRNAFPDFNFRGIEIIRLVTSRKVIEGKSWNHDFIVRYGDLDGVPVWRVSCHRTSHGETADKSAILNADTLELIQ